MLSYYLGPSGPFPGAALQLASSSGCSLHPGRSCWGRVEELTPPWRRAVTLIRRCTPCSPDAPLVLFFCPECELGHRWTDRRVWKEM